MGETYVSISQFVETCNVLVLELWIESIKMRVGEQKVHTHG